MEITIPGIGHLCFDEDSVPTFYQWSGYVKSVDEFKRYNFLSTTIDDHEATICSADIGVAMGDYLSTYILKSPIMWDLEGLLGGSIAYWFYKAWEQAEPYFDDQGWLIDIVQVFIDRNLIIRISGDRADYFCLIDFSRFEDCNGLDDVLPQVNEICSNSLATILSERIVDASYEEVPSEELSGLQRELVSPQARTIFDNLLKEHHIELE